MALEIVGLDVEVGGRGEKVGSFAATVQHISLADCMAELQFLKHNPGRARRLLSKLEAASRNMYQILQMWMVTVHVSWASNPSAGCHRYFASTKLEPQQTKTRA